MGITRTYSYYAFKFPSIWSSSIHRDTVDEFYHQWCVPILAFTQITARSCSLMSLSLWSERSKLWDISNPSSIKRDAVSPRNHPLRSFLERRESFAPKIDNQRSCKAVCSFWNSWIIRTSCSGLTRPKEYDNCMLSESPDVILILRPWRIFSLRPRSISTN